MEKPKQTFFANLVDMVGFPGGSDGKECLQCRRPRFDLWVRKKPQRGEWLPTLVFLPGEFHGKRSLVGYSPWGRKELDMTEQLSLQQDKGTGLS